MRRALRAFARRAWMNIASPSAYRAHLKTSFWSSFWYLYWLIAATVFVTMLVILVEIVFFLPALRDGVAVVNSDLPALYPPDLEVTLKAGELSTNMPEPFSIDLPQHWRDFLSDGDNDFPAHLLTFDTSAHVEDYDPSQTLALATRTALVLPDKEMSYRVVAFDQIDENFTMTKDRYDAFAAAVTPYLLAVPTFLLTVIIILVVLLPFVGGFFLLFGYLLYLLLATLLFWMIAAIMNRKIGYGGLYLLALNALTAPLLITFILGWFGIDFPFFFSLLLLGWMIAVVRFLPRSGKKA